MKVLLNALNILILIFFISFSKEDICPQGEISVSALGKCKTIQEFLENENLNLKTENLLYLASNNQGKIEKNGYKLEIFKLNDTKLQSHNKRKSKLYFPKSCLENMENNNQIKLDKSKGIVILISDNNKMNKNNISDIYFIIRHNSANSNKNYINSKVFDFSFCHEEPILFDNEININDLRYNYNDNTKIDLDKILYGKKFGIDLFNPYSDFLNDICFKFKSEKGADVTLESRVEDYYQNITFCDEKKSSHYLSYNYSAEKNTFTYRCAYGFYKSEADKSSYLDIIDSELKSLVSVSNFKVITCYKKFLNLKDIIKNYGGMICILVLIIQIICFLIFCFCGIKPIEEKLSDLFILGVEIIKRLTNFRGININLPKEVENNKGKPKKLFNLWGRIKLLRQKNLLKPKPQNKEKKDMFPPKRKSKSKNRKSVRVEEGNEIQIQDYKEENDIKNVQKKEPEVKHKKKKSLKTKDSDKKEPKDVINIEDNKLEYKKNNENEKKKTDEGKQKKRKSLISKDSERKGLNEKVIDIGEIKLEEKENKENEKKNSGTKKKKKKKKSSMSKSTLPKDILNVENDNLEIKENFEIKKDKKERKRKTLISKSSIAHQNEIIISDYNEDDEKKDEQVEATRMNLNSTENSSKISRFKNSQTNKEKDSDLYTNDDKISETSQIYEYNSDELNELSLDKAIKFDKRSFCAYYGNILMFSHIILNVFFRHNDYNLFVVKLGLLFMTFPINLTFNTFFYTNKSIKLSYIRSMDDISAFWSNISKTIYSSILSSTLLIILKLICLTHNSVKGLRKIKDVGFAKKKSVGILRCIRIRVAIYFILSLSFLVIFGFYNLCFCAIFENTQVILVKSTFTSWLISLLYPFIICFFTGCVRILSFRCNSKFLHIIKRLMQFL